MDTKVTIRSETVDLAGKLPLTVGDWMALEEQHGIGPLDFGSDTKFSVIKSAKYCAFVCERGNPRMNLGFFSTIDVGELLDAHGKINTIRREIDDAKAASQTPISASSTTSLASTDGASTT